MFPSGFNAVLTDWQIPRLNGVKSFHQDAHARYISIAYFEYIAERVAVQAMLFTSTIYQTRRPIENLTYHRSAMTNEIITRITFKSIHFFVFGSQIRKQQFLPNHGVPQLIYALPDEKEIGPIA